MKVNRNGRRLIAVAAAVLLVIGASVVYLLASGTSDDHVATTPDSQSGFDSWGPGWHQIDRSGLPAMAVSSIAWFQGRLIVVGGSMEIGEAEQASWRGVARVYDPATKRWSEIPGPNLIGASLVAAGDRLVAVGAGSASVDKPNTAVTPNHWATWTGGNADWVDQRVMPANPDIERLGPTGMSSDRARYLIWTGRTLIDFTSGTVLHPDTGKMDLIDLPQGVLTYRYLSRTAPVWTGSEVVWPAAGISSDAVGFRWASDGTDVTEIPASPPEDFGDPPSDGAERLLVLANGGKVILLAGDGPAKPYVQSFDPQTNKWSSLPATERLAGPACFDGGTTTGGDMVLVPCLATDNPKVPMVWRNGNWFDTEPLPTNTKGAPYVLSRQAGASLVIWSLTPAEPDGKQSDFAAVWVPEPTSRLTPAVRKSEPGQTTTTLAGDG